MSPFLLWVVPKCPVPPTDGARVASRNLLKGIITLGARVHLVMVPPADEARLVDFGTLREDLPVERVTVLPRTLPKGVVSRSVALGLSWMTRPRVPVTAASFCEPGVSEALARLARDHQGGLVVYDGLHVAAHLLDQGGQAPEATSFLLRAHNREAELWRQKARLARTLPERLFFAAQARAMALFEGSIARRARGVATVSDRDRALLLQDVPQLLPERVVTIPIGYEFGTPPRFPDAAPWRLLFVGRLDWPPNREGLRWFLDAVWPEVLKEAPRWHLTVAGSGDGGWLESYKATPRLDIRGFVNDVTGLYEASSLAILPLFVGSGTRVKAIEAARFGRPCLSTALGIEGLGLVNDVNYLRAESAREWTRRLVDAHPGDLKMKGEQAWQALRPAFDLAAPAAAFLDFARRAAPGQGA